MRKEDGGRRNKKKTLPLGDVFFLWVPGRTRTVDIQNHNLSCIVIYPVDFHQVNELSIRSSVNYK